MLTLKSTLMTFNSLDGMEEAVLREASVLPAVLQNWPGGHLGNNDAATFFLAIFSFSATKTSFHAFSHSVSGAIQGIVINVQGHLGNNDAATFLPAFSFFCPYFA